MVTNCIARIVFLRDFWATWYMKGRLRQRHNASPAGLSNVPLMPVFSVSFWKKNVISAYRLSRKIVTERAIENRKTRGIRTGESFVLKTASVMTMIVETMMVRYHFGSSHSSENPVDLGKKQAAHKLKYNPKKRPQVF